MVEEEIQRIIGAIENRGFSASQVIELINKSNVSNVQNEKVVDTVNEIKLSIDYTKTVEQVIADGNYNRENSDVTSKNFPISPEMIEKKVEVSTKLFHFNRNISSEDVISEMDEAGYRPANLMELLVLGASFPELQGQFSTPELQGRFSTIALGSVWHDAYDGRHVPYLDVNGSRRELDLDHFDGAWSVYCRFFGVRK